MVDVFITNHTLTMNGRSETISFYNGVSSKMYNLFLAILCANGKVSATTDGHLKVVIPDRSVEFVDSILDMCKVGQWHLTAEIIDVVMPRILQTNFSTPEKIPEAIKRLINQEISFNAAFEDLQAGKTVNVATDDGTFTITPHNWHRRNKKSLGEGILGYLDIKFNGIVNIELNHIRVKYEDTFFDILYPPHLGLAELIDDLGAQVKQPAMQKTRCTINNSVVIDKNMPRVARHSVSSALSVALKQHIPFNTVNALV